jgi:UDP-N-acetylglucosamine--N-acetylmuramyl-(pentapeptide) pyrophosphoryl-undecaprenol N-acetylglucosamine transferase
MRGPTVQPIVLAAGGTGGHLFPAEALARELTRRGRRVAVMTDRRSAARAREAFEGLELFVLHGAGLAGRGAARAAMGVAAISAGIVQARGLLGRLGAAAVVGFGGYPAVAPLLAARLRRTRPALVLHEQNAVLGRANRSLARLADTLALSFEATAGVPDSVETVVTGNPVRPAIQALAGRPYLPPTEGEIRLLVFGGSLGARALSDLLPPAIAELPLWLLARLRVAQQCRAEDLDRVRAAYAALGVEAELATFFPDVAERLADAHLVISRAGASTVAELACAGRPAVLVPLPGAIDDHQRWNARALDAEIADQAEISATALGTRLGLLLTRPDQLAALAAAVARHARPHAAARLADLVEAQSLANRAGAQSPANGVEMHITQDARLQETRP